MLELISEGIINFNMMIRILICRDYDEVYDDYIKLNIHSDTPEIYKNIKNNFVVDLIIKTKEIIKMNYVNCFYKQKRIIKNNKINMMHLDDFISILYINLNDIIEYYNKHEYDITDYKYLYRRLLEINEEIINEINKIPAEKIKYYINEMDNKKILENNKMYLSLINIKYKINENYILRICPIKNYKKSETQIKNEKEYTIKFYNNTDIKKCENCYTLLHIDKAIVNLKTNICYGGKIEQINMEILCETCYDTKWEY